MILYELSKQLLHYNVKHKTNQSFELKSFIVSEMLKSYLGTYISYQAYTSEDVHRCVVHMSYSRIK